VAEEIHGIWFGTDAATRQRSRRAEIDRITTEIKRLETLAPGDQRLPQLRSDLDTLRLIETLDSPAGAGGN
jgi:hypothetical protein